MLLAKQQAEYLVSIILALTFFRATNYLFSYNRSTLRQDYILNPVLVFQGPQIEFLLIPFNIMFWCHKYFNATSIDIFHIFSLYEYMSISPQKDLSKMYDLFSRITIYSTYLDGICNVANQTKYHTLPYCVCIQQLWGVSSKKILLLPIMSSDDEHSFFLLSLSLQKITTISFILCILLRATNFVQLRRRVGMACT